MIKAIKTLLLILTLVFVVLLFSCEIKIDLPIDDSEETSDNFVLSTRMSALNDVFYDYDSEKTYENEELYSKLSLFSSSIFSLCSPYIKEDNYCISPLSIYMAFSILHYIGDENVKKDVQELLMMNEDDINESGKLFLRMLYEKVFEDKLISKLLLTNSIWLDISCEANQIVLDELAKKFYCYAYKTPFYLDNKKANQDIRDFIKEKTNGLIDKDFELRDLTIFAIINTLYFKDMWKQGEVLEMSLRNFYKDNEVLQKVFLYSKYISGKVQKEKDYSFFYTITDSNYKLKLILPNKESSLDECLNSEIINYVNTFNEYENFENKKKEMTRCIFPAFKVSSSTPLKDILEENNYLPHAFVNYESSLLKGSFYVSDIKHQVELEVNDEGIEGAAVTIIASEKNGGLICDCIYNDFVINRGFIVLVTDIDDCIMFIGRIENPESDIDINNLIFVKE